MVSLASGGGRISEPVLRGVRERLATGRPGGDLPSIHAWLSSGEVPQTRGFHTFRNPSPWKSRMLTVANSVTP